MTREPNKYHNVNSGGPTIDLISILERYIYRTPIDENEQDEFNAIDLVSIALKAAETSENTALHQILDELAYIRFFTYGYEEPKFFGDEYELAQYVIQLFNHMELKVPDEFYSEDIEDISEAMEKYSDYFQSGLKIISNMAFAQLWYRKGFLYDFNMRLSETISPLLKSDYPILAQNGRLKRARSFRKWIIDLLVKREQGRCYYCNNTIMDSGAPNKNYDIDHIIPLARGGTNDPTNLALACPSCNNKKRAELLPIPENFAWPIRAN